MSITVTGADKLADDLKSIAQNLPVVAEKLEERLCEEGRVIAEQKFANAIYSGINDVTVSVEKEAEGHSIIAQGDSVLFIEYGTGINTPPHPEQPEDMPRGGYGFGMGKRKKWGYHGDPGNNPDNVVINKREGYWGGAVVITPGDPAARAMYDAKRTIRLKAPTLIEEILKNG